MRRCGAILIAAVALSLLGAACANDDAITTATRSTTSETIGSDRAALFSADPILARNATPTPTPTPRPTPQSAPTPPSTPTPHPAPTATSFRNWPSRSEMQSLLGDLITDVSKRSTDVSVSITVYFDENTVTASNGLSVFPSASLAKAWWVAAAVAEVGPAKVEPFAEPIFAISDNDAAAGVIDLVGVDGVNETTLRWGMSDTYLSSWTLTRPRTASDRDQRGPTNVTTTRDAARFMRDLATGSLLSSDETDEVLGWMSETPFDRETDPYGSVLVADLPATIAATSAHKAGWLPPECCDRGPEHEVLAAAGIVPCQPGALRDNDESFQVALATVDGNDYVAELEWMSAATATIAEALCPDLKRWERNDTNRDDQRRQ